MQPSVPFEPSVSDALLASAIGQFVLRQLRACRPGLLAQEVDSAAVRLLEKIRDILNDKTLSDPECFWRIDELTEAFFAAGVPTTRHEEVE